jgi:acyl-CoA synthetase (AMP-forming)/AMP-acid ligase II
MSASEAAPGRAVGRPLGDGPVLLPADYPSHFAAKHPNRVALQHGVHSLTYAELDRACDAMVAMLAEQGVGQGGRFAIMARNSDMFFVVLIAAARAGAVVVPINWRNTAAETRYVIEDSEVTLAIAEREFVPVVQAAAGEGFALLVLDGEGPDGLRARIAATDPAPRGDSSPTRPWLQLYTSGTTGRPKGVVSTQYAFAVQRLMEDVCGHFDDWGDDEILLSPLPSFHIGGMTWAFNGPCRGQTTILTNDASPAGLLDQCLAFGITRTFLVPLLVRGLIGEMDARNVRVPTLRGIHYGAASMDPALLDRSVDKFGCKFLQYYGMTEVTGSITILGPTFHDSARPKLLRSVGQPLPGFAIEIRGPDKALLAVDEPGEIWVNGPSLLIEYWNKPEATAEALQDGWYRSGDGGRIDAEGFLFLTDRIKDMIVSGGENVYPAEVEAALRDHPAVQDVAVFGLPHPKWGEGVTAVIELKLGQSATQDELIAYARTCLAAYKIPRRIEIGVVLPRTASGKVQRGTIRKTYLDAGTTTA